MPNSLTGGFDTVVLIRLPIINGLLATLHRNRGSESRSPSLLHSFTMPVGTPGLSAEDHQILAWARSLESAGGLMRVGRKAAEAAPPGVLRAVEEADLELQRVADDPLRIQGWNGYAQVQVSSPTVAFQPGATREVTSTFKLRARFLRSVGSATLGEPIHGEVRANFLVDLVSSDGGAIVLAVEPSGDDGEIYFTPAPGTGLNDLDVGKISLLVRDSLRTRFETTTLELEAGFPLSGFKALGAGSGQALALPLMLSGNPAPSLSAVDNHFLLSSDHFGIGIAREFVDPKLQPMLDSLESISFDQAIEFLGITLATYHVSVSSASLAWKTGELEVTVHGTAVTGSIFPNYSFTVRQRLTLVLDPATQSVTLVALGDPSITGSLPDSAAEEALPTIKSHRDAAIASAQSQIAAALAEVSLDDALSSFDGAPPTHYTSLNVLPAGIILHGQVEYRGAAPAQLDIRETADGKGFTALHSWMPGGWIDRFLWSWKEAGFMQNPWGGTVHTEIREHVFTLAKPTPESNVASICLLVEGSQLTSVGTEVPVEGGEVCKVSVPSWMVATMPTWWDLLLPIWEVDPPSEQVLEEAIVAHVNMNAHAVGRARLGANTLVHFAGEGAQSPLDALDEALGGLRGGGFESRSQPGDAAAGAGQPAREKPPLALCVVLPRGAFSEPRATVEKRLGSLAPDLDVLLSLTEDYEGSWSRAFGHGKGPGSYLLNARGDFVWKHQGAPEARAFEEIGRHLLNGSPLRYHALRLDLPRCGPAPDLLYPTSGGTRLALRRLRGRPVTLLFWKSWSRACIREILRLQSRREEEGERVILAIVSGEDPGRLPRLAEEHGLSLTLVPDPQGRIARRYGISCWPTSVFVDPEGRVSGAHFGAHRGHHRHAAADAGSQRS